VTSGYLSEVFVSFQGEGAHVGRRHLFVRLAGCNLRCRYCDTPESLTRTAGYTVFTSGGVPLRGDNPVTVEEARILIGSALEKESPVDAIAFTGGEPLVQSKFLAALLASAAFPTPVLLETNGMLPTNLQDVLPWVHVISMDIKLASNTGERAFWEEHGEFLELARGKDLYVKIPVDGMTTDADVERAAAMLALSDPAIPAFLQPIVDLDGKPLTGAEPLTRLYLAARRYLSSIRVIPQTHKILGIR
jgi:7-carboxy-7-deazaguanine synthase